MPWGVAAAVVVGAAASNQASKKQTSAINKASNIQQDQFNTVRGDTAAYREIGGNAINKLADILGVERSGPSEPDREKFYSGGSPSQPGWKQYGVSASPIANYAIGKKKKQAQQPVFDEAGYNAAMDQYRREKEAFDNRPRGMDAWTPDPGYQFRLDNTNKTIDRYQSAGRITGGRALKEAQRYGQDFASNEFGNSVNRLFSLAGYGPQGINTSASAGMNAANNMSNLSLQSGNVQAQNYANINNAVQGGLQNYATYRSYNDWKNN